MKILLYTREFPPIAGGAGIYTSNLAKSLNELGHDIMVLAPAYSNVDNDWDTKQPYSIIRMSLLKHAKLGGSLLGSLYLIKNCITLRPETICVTDAGSQRSAAFAILLFSLSYSITVHGSEINLHFKKEGKFIHRLISPILRHFYRKAETIICVSQATKELLLRTFPDLHKQTAVVLHGIDLNRFKAVTSQEVERLRRTLNLKGPVLLTVARLIPEKGHDIVLKTLKKIVREIPDIKYLIVGIGSDRERLEALVKKLSLERNVLFMGKVPSNILGTYYALCDIFIMISRPSERGAEAFGLVYAEAGAYNKPIIAGRIGGVPEAVEDGYNGILVDPLNEREVEMAIRRLLTDSDLAQRMGANGRKRVENEFNAKVMAKRTLEALTK